jgi:hypothetical protein
LRSALPVCWSWSFGVGSWSYGVGVVVGSWKRKELGVVGGTAAHMKVITGRGCNAVANEVLMIKTGLRLE